MFVAADNNLKHINSHNHVVYPSKGMVIVINMDTSKSYRVTTSISEFRKQITLKDIPERERWIWQNQRALTSVRRGLKQSAEGNGKYIGSFAAYADLEIDE